MLDIAALATTVVVNFLVPYLKTGAEEIAKQLGRETSETVGKEVAKVTERMWKRIKGLFWDEPTKKPLFETFEQYPDQTADVIKSELTRLLESNAELANELEALVEANIPGTNQTVAQVVENHGVSVVIQGSTVSGTVTGIMHAPPPSRDPR